MESYAVKLPEVGQMLQYCRCIRRVKETTLYVFAISH